MAGSAKTARQKKREIHYALDFRDGEVFLVQRARDARLMAGMWELPEVAGGAVRVGRKRIPRFARNDKTKSGANQPNSLLCTVRHSITVTDYIARVWQMDAPDGDEGKWIAVRRLGKLAITGLARKILQKAGLLF